MSAKQCLFVGVLTLLCLSLANAAPPAVHPVTKEPLVIDCYKGTPEAIDGDLSDWPLSALTPAILDAPEQMYTGQASWDGPGDCSGEFYVLWDDDNIYVAAIIKDDKLSMTKTGGDIWNADAIEIFFSTLNAVSGHAEHYQYGANANKQKWIWDAMGGTTGFAPPYMELGAAETGDGYSLEISIPHSEIKPLDWTAGNAIGFHPVIDDTEATDREIQMTWTGREAHDQSLGFGHIILSDVAISGGNPLARRPSPEDGAMLTQTWATLTWTPGQFAVTHDVYVGDNFDDVNNATHDSGTFAGNQPLAMLVVGFPGFPIPDGLMPGTTYYWRVDEVNDANTASPWKGNIWSFSIQPYIAYNPSPADGAEFVATDATFTWTPGYGAKLHTVYTGTDYNTVANAAGGAPQGQARYKPAAALEAEKVYYWRVDEFDAFVTRKGDIWGFTTPGAAGNPKPANGSVNAPMVGQLSWTPAAKAVSHDVYIGTDKDAVRNATKASPEFKGNKALGSESLDPGKLAWLSEYYWRVDAVYSTGTVKGLVWSFTTADFISVDDFESYNDIDPPDPAANRIFDNWIDGFGTTNNGALVGNDMPPYAERNSVHGGAQSMPYNYDNTNKTSEATLTLSYPRDWTDEGVTKLVLWHRGSSKNSPEKMYVALNGNAVVYNEDLAAAQKGGWNRWIIDLQAFANQGVNLANVNTISLGFGTKGSPAAGGTGKVFFDDIKLVR